MPAINYNDPSAWSRVHHADASRENASRDKPREYQTGKSSLQGPPSHSSFLSRHIRSHIDKPSCTERNALVPYGLIPLGNSPHMQRISRNRPFDWGNGRMLHKMLTAKSTSEALGNTMKREQKYSVAETSLWPDTADIGRGLSISSA